MTKKIVHMRQECRVKVKLIGCDLVIVDVGSWIYKDSSFSMCLTVFIIKM
jgi:hypothetical protein